MPVAVDVLLPLPLQPLRYLVPFDAEPGPKGGRVAVPWQGGVRLGLATGLADVSATQALELKEVIGWVDAEPYVLADAVEHLGDLAAYAGAPQGILLATLVPGGFKDDVRYLVRAVEGASVGEISADRWTSARDVEPAALALWRQQGLLRERVELVAPTETVVVPVRAADDDLGGAPRANQRTALAWLEAHGTAESGAALARAADVPESAVRALIAKGYAAYRDVPIPPPTVDTVAPGEPLPPVAPHVDGAAPALVSGGTRASRLAALLPLLDDELTQGRTPTVLFPEQAFLDEGAAWLAAHLPVVALSGDMPDDMRAAVWDHVAHEAAVVLVGTYLALLAPRPRAGAIVVCEAGASTFKLPAGARLFVPEAARRLAAALNVPFAAADVVAGPELRAWVEDGAHHRLPRPRQRVHVADLGGATSWPIGPELSLVLRQVESRDRQAVVLAPRRGFSGALGCPDCGWVAECPNCDLTLRYHQRERRVRCHQCGHEASPPALCPSCGTPDLTPLRGAGTEWLAQAVRTLVPSLSVLRFDADHRDDLAELYDGAPGVVVGTTSLLRIRPLPNLSLVGLAGFDAHLAFADFRAEEDALRLLLQLPEIAADRVPLTVVQTYRPDHPILQALTSEDPEFEIERYLAELGRRREAFGYPPATHLAKVQLSARDRATAHAAAHDAVDRLRTAGADPDEVLGPAPAPVARVRGQHTYQLFLRSPSEARFRELLAGTDAAARGVRVRIDVDPRDVGEFLE